MSIHKESIFKSTGEKRRIVKTVAQTTTTTTDRTARREHWELSKPWEHPPRKLKSGFWTIFGLISIITLAK